MFRISLYLLILMCTLAGTHAYARDRTPNIVLIFADDLGWADLPVYGNRVTEAPAIDKLARQGARFTRFYAQPVCSPSRVELMSGNYPVRYGITDFIPGHWRPFEKVVTPRTAVEFRPNLPAMGSALKALGYRTAYFGKWHLGENLTRPPSLGFDEYNINYGFDHMSDPTTPSADAIAARAESVIGAAGKSPFLLVLSPSQPHIPLRAHASDIAHFQHRLEVANARLPVAEYSAMVLDFDRLVGRVVVALDQAGLAANTLLVVMSDNGGLEHTDLGINDPVTTNAPLRGEKGTLYEGGIRIPMIVRWPHRIAGGTVITTPAALMDLLSTFIDAAGGRAAGRDGRSLVALLAGRRVLQDRALYFHYPHYHHGRPASAMIEGRWKLIQNLDDRSLELFDLETDEPERVNLASRESTRASNMLASLDVWRSATQARLPTPNPRYNPSRAAEWWNPQTGTLIKPDELRAVLGPRPIPEKEVQ